MIRNLDSENSAEKISILKSLTQTNDAQIVQKMIMMLNDADITVRGEAFSSLILNENNILQYLIDALDSENKNVRG